VNVDICGGGPAGLYLAILLRRSGDHRVTVHERNRPGATYGWGVVFSAESLAELRDADYETYLAIDEALVRWSSIDVHHAGRRTRSTGHAFSAIARTELLRILSTRATAVGADVRYEDPFDPTSPPEGCDLVVGADGIRSTVRAAFPDRFGTSERTHSARYVWFGTDLVLPVFTFIFQPTAAGLFQVHAYPFDASGSTFIVETTEAAWRASGLDAMGDEEAVAFCEELFAPWLDGSRLFFKPNPGRPMWNTFTTLGNRSWHCTTAGGVNVVLLGDAAHTAHFSIGSGTRLALDDAIALDKAFVAEPDHPERAFAAYEGERQAVVERFQQVATDSSRYFETVGRYLDLPPEQFAFNLLTRSGRITHLELTRRDPALVNEVDRVFAGDAGRLTAPPPVLTALRLGGPAEAVANRIVIVPDTPDDAVEGVPGPGHQVLVAAAGAGAGLVVTEPVAPVPGGRVTSGSAGLWSDDHTAAWAALTDAVHARGASCALRLTHAGRRGATLPRHRGVDRPLPDGWPLFAASAVAYGPRSRTPAELSAGGMAVLARAFGAAAGRAAEAGFDVVILDMSDGYLLSGFLSPLANRRTDDHGGPLAARARFPLAVLDAVRAAWGDRPLAVRLTIDDGRPDGLTPDDAASLAPLLMRGGVTLVDVAAGYGTGDERWAPDYRRLYNVGLAERIRNEHGVAVMVGGHITRLDEVNTILAAGRADLCVLDPHLYRNGGLS
jgi:anthraniloyl-CoA monooxygenase